MKIKKALGFMLGMVFIVMLGSGFTGKQKAPQVIPAFKFELEDQNGKIHRLSDYKGKVIFLNFWATWCPACLKEAPDVQEIYKEYGKNKKDVVILTVLNPSTRENPRNNDKEISQVKEFIRKKNYEFPALMDKTGDVYSQYQIQAFPTTFVITKEGNIKGYVVGGLHKEDMKMIIEDAKSGK